VADLEAIATAAITHVRSRARNCDIPATGSQD